MSLVKILPDGTSHQVKFNSEISHQYDENGILRHTENSLGSETWFDEEGNKIHYKTSGLQNYEAWYEYDYTGNLTHSQSDDGYEQWSEYNANNQPTHFVNTEPFEEWLDYDPLGNVCHYRNSEGVEFFDHALGTPPKKRAKKQAAKRNPNCTYDSHGNRTSLKNKGVYRKFWEYDYNEEGKILKIREYTVLD